MSILSEKTERKALIILAKMVRDYEKLHLLNMTTRDDWDATAAKNLLQAVIESNGYQIEFSRSRRKLIKRLPKELSEKRR